jgi:gas vesicle protein
VKTSLSYFLVGAGIGCGVAILMAPQTGRKLREQIRDETSRRVKWAKQSGRELRDQAVGLARKGSQAVATRKDAAAAAIGAGKHAYRQVVRA